MGTEWGTAERVMGNCTRHSSYCSLCGAETLISAFRKTYHGNKIRKAESPVIMLPLKHCFYSHPCTCSLVVTVFVLCSHWNAYLDFLSCQGDWPASACRGGSTRSLVTEGGKNHLMDPTCFSSYANSAQNWKYVMHYIMNSHLAQHHTCARSRCYHPDNSTFFSTFW